MDFCRNIPLSGNLTPEYQPDQGCSKLGSLDDLFSGHTTEGDVNLEWLSIFVEDCLSSSGNCVILPPNPEKPIIAASSSYSPVLANPKPEPPKSPLHKFIIPSKARTKRKRNPLSISKNPLTSWSHNFNPHGQTLQNFQITNSDPPLLQQTYWLADSELILPKKPEFMMKENQESRNDEEFEVEEEEGVKLGHGTRRCSHCLSQRTPQWRAGPLGPKTLCNACGVRYKSGRLLPEYRPAKSPTFVSYKHSNSHKKVLEMRMSSSSSTNS